MTVERRREEKIMASLMASLLRWRTQSARTKIIQLKLDVYIVWASLDKAWQNVINYLEAQFPQFIFNFLDLWGK
jgi:hypothetical protein